MEKGAMSPLGDVFSLRNNTDSLPFPTDVLVRRVIRCHGPEKGPFLQLELSGKQDGYGLWGRGYERMLWKADTL